MKICGNCFYAGDEPFCQFAGEISYNFSCEQWKPKKMINGIELIASPEDYTCYKCEDKYNCPHAYDEYNKNGDCLAEK